jgi:hypothetical protein
MREYSGSTKKQECDLAMGSLLVAEEENDQQGTAFPIQLDAAATTQ